jgi:formate dehydrogenase subunit delta
MNPEVMVHKINQIANFFASYPHDEAVAGVATHIVKYWEARMRRQLMEYYAAGGAGLSPLALEAIGTLPASTPA